MIPPFPHFEEFPFLNPRSNYPYFPPPPPYAELARICQYQFGTFDPLLVTALGSLPLLPGSSVVFFTIPRFFPFNSLHEVFPNTQNAGLSALVFPRGVTFRFSSPLSSPAILQ